MCTAMKVIVGGLIVIVLLATGCCMVALAVIVKEILGVYFNLGWIVPLLIGLGVVSIVAGLFAALGLCNCCDCCCTKTFLFAAMLCICCVVIAEIVYMVKVHRGKENIKDYLVGNISDTFLGNMSEYNTDPQVNVKWTVLQAKFDCCGKYEPGDWTDNGVEIPTSCCKEFKFEGLPEDYKSLADEDPKKLLEHVTNKTCDVNGENTLKEEGCLKKLDALFEKGFRWLKWGVLGLLLFQILAGAFFMFLFIREVIQSNDDEDSARSYDSGRSFIYRSNKGVQVG